MAEISIAGSCVSSSLYQLLMAEDITPGDEPSYQLCKTIYSFHPLGGKIVDGPIQLAMSQARNISVPAGPEDRIREAFEREWKAIGADRHISNTVRLAKIYGASALVYGSKDTDTDKPIKPEELANLELYFNALDPLNTAGSLVLNQDPNAPDFQKPTIITAAGQAYHPSRTCIFFNESPLYIEYTQSAFGYVGRSAYQRALFPLKTFVQSMITDDMVTRKAGVLVAKIKGTGSFVDRAMQIYTSIKRNIVKEAETNNVINITPEDSIETLNLMNTDTAMTTARKNALENVAVATPMPAKMLNSESYAEGFGEGQEDAKDVIRYIEGLRKDMQPLFDFFDPLVMYRAWTPEFYATIQNDFPDYKDIPYTQAFFAWKNAFVAEWPSLLVEPESKLVEVDDVKLKAIIALCEVMLPTLDPSNKARLVEWACDNFNECKTLLKHPLVLDMEDLRDYVPPEPPTEPKEPKPFSAQA